jgi:hypothetical protein
MRIRLCLILRVFTILLAFLFVITPSGFGQDCRITTTVRLLDERSRPASNVSADQLKATIDGAPARVITFAPGVKPVTVLLIDTSSGMKGAWPQSLAAAKQLATSAGDLVAAVVFREEIKDRASGRTETGKLLDRLATLKTSPGGTALYDALIDTAQHVENPDTVLIVISDGEDNASRNSSAQTLRWFLKNRWPPVFGLILDYSPDRDHSRRAWFSKIVAGTGGLVAFPSSASNVAEAANQLAAEVYAPFTVTLQTSQPLSKSAKLQMEITNADNTPRHDIQIAHVAEITGCDAVSTSSAKTKR